MNDMSLKAQFHLHQRTDSRCLVWYIEYSQWLEFHLECRRLAIKNGCCCVLFFRYASLSLRLKKNRTLKLLANGPASPLHPFCIPSCYYQFPCDTLLTACVEPHRYHNNIAVANIILNLKPLGKAGCCKHFTCYHNIIIVTVGHAR